MWKLEPLTNNTGVFLQQGCELTVSRQDSSWLHLAGDASISRKHALLRLQHTPQAVKRNVLSTVELQDLNPKNGTYFKRCQDVGVNVEFTEADRLQAGTTITLNDGDIVRFGLYKNCYRVLRCPLVVATSMLAPADTEAVLAALLLLGATFSKAWTDQCTHLVMDSIKLSAKVSCALAYGAAIVTPTFLTAICSAVKNKEGVLPPHTPFMPPITEPGIQPIPSLFERNVERRRVLAGLRFLFASQRTSKRLSCIVLSAGGSCGLLSARDHATLAAGQALLVRGQEDGAASASQASPFSAALAVVQRAGLNPVPESDIALAVLYCSTERFCNPALSQQNLVAPTVPQSEQESLVVFAPGTESFSVSPLPPSRTAAAARTRRGAAVPERGAAVVVPDTPASTASTAPRRTNTAASTPSCRTVSATAEAENTRTEEASRMQEGDGNQSAAVSPLRGAVSMDATPSLALSSPARPVQDSPARSRLARKRGRHSGSSASSADEGAPVPKRSTAAAAIEPTHSGALSQDDERTVPFGDISGLEIGQFAPKDTSTQKMDEEVIPARSSAANTLAQPVVAEAGNMCGPPVQLSAQRTTRRTKVVTTVPPTPTPPSQHFPSSISIPPTPTPPPSRLPHDPVPPASPPRAVSAAAVPTSPSLSPDKGILEQRKQQQRRETITLSTLPSLPAETYADSSLFPGITEEPPPTLDPPSPHDAAWLPAQRRPLTAVNDEHSSRRSLNRDDVSGILDPPPGSAGANARAGGPIKVERSESRDVNVFQMPSTTARRRKTQQTAAVPPPATEAPTALERPAGGIKRSRSTEEREVMEQQAVEPNSRRIKCEPESQPESSVAAPPAPATPAGPTQRFLSKPSRANGCNNTTVGLNCTSAAVTGAPHSVNATRLSPSKPAGTGDENVKPEAAEVTRLSRTLLVSLVLRTSILGDQYSPPSNNTTVSGKRNFKCFKKVTRFSSERPSQAMPRIIGGRDLRPHTEFNTDADGNVRATDRPDSLRATWLSQHPDASCYLDQEERDRQERLREDWDDDSEQGNTGRGGDVRSRGSTMMSYLTTTSGSACGRSAPGPSTDVAGLAVFRRPEGNIRIRQRR